MIAFQMIAFQMIDSIISIIVVISHNVNYINHSDFYSCDKTALYVIVGLFSEWILPYGLQYDIF